MPTLADTYLTDNHREDTFAIGKDENGYWRVTLVSPFGSVLLASGEDAGTLLGELALIADATQALIQQSDPEPDPVNISWAFMAWLNGSQGATIHLGSNLRIKNPDHGTRRALGGMNITIAGEHFSFNTDAFYGLSFIRSFASAANNAACAAMRWIDAVATYRLEVPEALLAQADKIELFGEDGRTDRARFGIEVGKHFAVGVGLDSGARNAIKAAIARWGWEARSVDTRTLWRALIHVKSESLGKLLQDIGNALAANPSATVRLFDDSVEDAHSEAL